MTQQENDMSYPAIATVSFLLTGTVIALGAALCNRKAIGRQMYGRKHRRESVSHPEQRCRFCKGTSTRLVQARRPMRAWPELESYMCKDYKLCRATQLLNRQLDRP